MEGFSQSQKISMPPALPSSFNTVDLNESVCQ
jgi:hypothetical protein